MLLSERIVIAVFENIKVKEKSLSLSRTGISPRGYWSVHDSQQRENAQLNEMHYHFTACLPSPQQFKMINIHFFFLNAANRKKQYVINSYYINN